MTYAYIRQCFQMPIDEEKNICEQRLVIENFGMNIDGYYIDTIGDVYISKTNASPTFESFDKMAVNLKKGDTVIVYRIDVFGKDAVSFLRLMRKFREKGYRFISISDRIDTDRDDAVFEHFELILKMYENMHRLHKERLQARFNNENEKRTGKKMGRPQSLSNEQIEEAIRLKKEGVLSIAQIKEKTGVSKSQLYYHLKTNPLGFDL